MIPDSCHPRTLIEILQWIMGGPLIFTFLRVRFHKSLKWTGLQNLCLHPALVCWSSNKKKSLDRSSRNDYFHSDVLEIHQNNLFFDHAATRPKHTKRNLVNN